MRRRIALKRLTASDLTLFEWHYRNRNAGNQKAINLNADVFVGDLFPSLPDIASEHEGRIPLDLKIYGPGLAPLHNLQRKIIKIASYKNWRLDGEMIGNPENEPARYDVLQADDLAIFEFEGLVVPDSAKMILISQNLKEDQQMHRALAPLVTNHSMVSVTVMQLREIALGLAGEDHPLYQLSLEAELEDAAENGLQGQIALRRVSNRVIT